LTNGTGYGNPICLVKPMSIELNTDEVKTDYYYGEPLSLNGLGVTLKRGSEYITAKLVPYTVETNYNAEKPGTYTVKISVSGCGEASFKVTVAEKPHVYKQVLKPSTCTTEGSVYYACQDEGCNAIFGEVQTLPARGHTMTHYDAVPASCDQVGRREYWHCTVCQKYFLDADGSKETIEENLAVVGEHTFGEPEYVWTKTENGFYTCTASVVCTNKNCPDYTDSTPMTEVGTVNWQIKDVPTCSKPAYALLTATFTKSPFTTQTKQVEVTASSCPSAAFSDAPDASNWAHDGIDFCISKKLMEGFPNGTFQPDNELTRAQMVTILYREAGSPDVEVTDRFSDVSADQWFAKAVCWAAENEVVNGYTDGTFLPNNPIKRQEVAAMLYRLEGSPAVDSSNLTSFPDYNTLQDWAKPALSWAVSEGLITGVGHDGLSYLRPIDPATRAQFATIIMRYLTEAK
ncbi:MAG: S-layer homology domain-containing protein, partial [Faecousia sp.]